MKLLAFACTCLVFLVSQPVCAVSVIGLNVRDYGAKGDGVTDDTAAFQTTIAQAVATGESAIVVPPGTYKITGTITLNGLAMNGSSAGTWNADNSSLPKILCASTSGPTVRLESGGSIHGLNLVRDWGGQTPSPRPPAILLAGSGCKVTEVKITQAWDGIIADGATDLGQVVIDKCFMVDVHNVGLRLVGTKGAIISRLEVWSPTSQSFPVSGIGMYLAKNELLSVSNSLVFKAHTAINLVNQIGGCTLAGPNNVTFTNCTNDASVFGFVVSGEQDIRVIGGHSWTHFGGMIVNGSLAKVQISGHELGANGAPALLIENAASIAVTSSRIRRVFAGYSDPALKINGGSSMVFTGCNILCNGTAIYVKPGLTDVLLANNVVKNNVVP